MGEETENVTHNRVTWLKRKTTRWHLQRQLHRSWRTAENGDGCTLHSSWPKKEATYRFGARRGGWVQERALLVLAPNIRRLGLARRCEGERRRKNRAETLRREQDGPLLCNRPTTLKPRYRRHAGKTHMSVVGVGLLAVPSAASQIAFAAKEDQTRVSWRCTDMLPQLTHVRQYEGMRG